jgi:diaminopimelate decarboxylase
MLAELCGRFGLPLHIVFTERVRLNGEAFQRAVQETYPKTTVCFAVKSNPCRGAVRLAVRHGGLGLGLDVVSEYELQAGLEEGVAPERIICNGNAKSDRYLGMAVESAVLVAVDSDFELTALEAAAGRLGREVQILVRFSGMPLEGLTDADQSTAHQWTKFGFPIAAADEVLARVCGLPHCRLVGISAHIGTQICDATGYDRLLDNLLGVAERWRGAGVDVRIINIGGGYPVSYLAQSDWVEFQRRLWRQLTGEIPTDEWVTWQRLAMGFSHALLPTGGDDQSPSQPPWRGKAYWSEYPGPAMLTRILKRKNKAGLTTVNRLRALGEPMMMIEPGRSLFGTAGVTVARVSGVKRVLGNNVVVAELGVVNHGTNLVAPDIFPFEVRPLRDDDQPVEAFIAGQLCFTGDMLSKIKVRLNRLPWRGDTLVIHHTGAYSADHFASNSCGFLKPAKVALREDGVVEVWRKREKYEEVFGREVEGEKVRK